MRKNKVNKLIFFIAEGDHGIGMQDVNETKPLHSDTHAAHKGINSSK